MVFRIVQPSLLSSRSASAKEAVEVRKQPWTCLNLGAHEAENAGAVTVGRVAASGRAAVPKRGEPKRQKEQERTERERRRFLEGQ